MSEDEPTEKERAEAEALARALDARSPDAHSLDARLPDAHPVDALETAALLRHDALSDLAERRVLARVMPSLPRRRISPWWALAGAALLLLLCGPIFLVRSSAPALSPTALPRPSDQLLAAQARAATDAPAVATLEHEMGRYRGALFDALAARYER